MKLIITITEFSQAPRIKKKPRSKRHIAVASTIHYIVKPQFKSFYAQKLTFHCIKMKIFAAKITESKFEKAILQST